MLFMVDVIYSAHCCTAEVQVNNRETYRRLVVKQSPVITIERKSLMEFTRSVS